jgi:hypothetical protein
MVMGKVEWWFVEAVIVAAVYLGYVYTFIR